MRRDVFLKVPVAIKKAIKVEADRIVDMRDNWQPSWWEPLVKGNALDVDTGRTIFALLASYANNIDGLATKHSELSEPALKARTLLATQGDMGEVFLWSYLRGGHPSADDNRLSCVGKETAQAHNLLLGLDFDQRATRKDESSIREAVTTIDSIVTKIPAAEAENLRRATKQ